MKRFKITLALFLLCVMAVFGFTSCKDNGGSSSVTGVYYLYENDTYDKSDYYESHLREGLSTLQGLIDWPWKHVHF